MDLRADRVAFGAAHLRGALHAPLAGGRLAMAAGSYVEESSRMLLVVEDESALDEAVRTLVRIGLDRVDGWIPAAEAAGAECTAPLVRIGPEALPAGAGVPTAQLLLVAAARTWQKLPAAPHAPVCWQRCLQPHVGWDSCGDCGSAPPRPVRMCCLLLTPGRTLCNCRC